MDYVVHFSDGSEGYLAHHGVKGMKWGVWNAETRARRLGSTSTQGDIIDKRKQAYDKAMVKQSNRGWKNPIAKRYYTGKANRALDKYAKATMKAYDPEHAAEREKVRKIEEAAADKHLGEAYRNEPAHNWDKANAAYWKTISSLERGRAVEKAIPQGKEAVKEVLRWGAKTSTKTDAAAAGVPVKTKQEAKRYRELDERFAKSHDLNYWDSTPTTKRAYEKAISDFTNFDEAQRKKYLNNY